MVLARIAVLTGLWLALSGATFVDRELVRLLISVKACRVRPPEEPPESAAFLEITDLGRRDTRPSQAFRGWMFASSPAVSAMEHPVYDIWVSGCQ